MAMKPGRAQATDPAASDHPLQALRYGEWSDGCVCQVDATLPGCRAVFLDDMDHFGPAWRSMPATDVWDPTRLWLACVSVAIGEV